MLRDCTRDAGPRPGGAALGLALEQRGSGTCHGRGGYRAAHRPPLAQRVADDRRPAGRGPRHRSASTRRRMPRPPAVSRATATPGIRPAARRRARRFAAVVAPLHAVASAARCRGGRSAARGHRHAHRACRPGKSRRLVFGRSFPANAIAAAAQGAMLPLVVFALLFGFALTRVEEAARRAPAGAVPVARRHDDRDRALGPVAGADRRIRAGPRRLRQRRRGLPARSAPMCWNRSALVYLGIIAVAVPRRTRVGRRVAAAIRSEHPARAGDRGEHPVVARLAARHAGQREPRLGYPRAVTAPRAADGGVAVPHHESRAVHRRCRRSSPGLRHRPAGAAARRGRGTRGGHQPRFGRPAGPGELHGDEPAGRAVDGPARPTRSACCSPSIRFPTCSRRSATSPATWQRLPWWRGARGRGRPRPGPPRSYLFPHRLLHRRLLGDHFGAPESRNPRWVCSSSLRLLRRWAWNEKPVPAGMYVAAVRPPRISWLVVDIPSFSPRGVRIAGRMKRRAAQGGPDYSVLSKTPRPIMGAGPEKARDSSDWAGGASRLSGHPVDRSWDRHWLIL